MPQMAPIGWLSLFIIFSMTFILFSMMNYYTALPSAPSSKLITTKSQSSMNWKW